MEENQARPFKFGQHDCCLFAANWVKFCLKKDPAKGLRNRYKSEPGALRILKREGGVHGLARKQLKRVKLPFAQRGDLVVYQRTDISGPAYIKNALGILVGGHAVFAGPDGFQFIKRQALMATAYKIGKGIAQEREAN